MNTHKVQLIILCCCTFFFILHLAKAKPRGPCEGNGMCVFNLAIPSDQFALNDVDKRDYNADKGMHLHGVLKNQTAVYFKC